MISRFNKLNAFKKWNAQTIIELKTSDEQLKILNQELKYFKTIPENFERKVDGD